MQGRIECAEYTVYDVDALCCEHAAKYNTVFKIYLVAENAAAYIAVFKPYGRCVDIGAEKHPALHHKSRYALRTGNGLVEFTVPDISVPT